MIKKYWKALLVFLILLVSFGQVMLMYFWQDDLALLFKLQHISEPMGSFGAGAVGEGPYKYMVLPFVPAFKFFGLNPTGYFIISFLSLLPVAYLFYLLAAKIFENKMKGFIATLIFASGYIGSEIMFRIINAWQTNVGLCLALTAIYFFVSCLKERKRGLSRKVVFYILSLVFFFLAVEFVYIRSHSLVFAFLVIDVVLAIGVVNLRKIFALLLRQIPFWLIFYKYYVNGVPAGQGGLKSFFMAITSGKLEYLSGLVGSIGNAIIPTFYQTKFISFVGARFNITLIGIFVGVSLLLAFVLKFKLWQKILLILGYPVLLELNKFFFSHHAYWYTSSESFFSVCIGLYTSYFVLLLAIFIWRSHKVLAQTIIIGYLSLVSQIFGYFIQYPQTIFETTHRYLSYAGFGYALMYAGIFLLFRDMKKKLIFVGGLTLLIFSNCVLSFSYQAKIVRDRSVSGQKFYKDLLQLEPSAKKDAIFYFDVKNNGFIRGQFRDFFSVGSMPDSTALAIWYNLDRDDIHFVTDYDEFIYTLSQTKDINNIYTFYYGDDGLVDTTQIFRSALLAGGSSFPGSFAEFKLAGKLANSGSCISHISDPSLNRYIDYLNSKAHYYRTVRVSSLSQWRGQEINYLTDENPDTSWRGHRIYWNEKGNEKLFIDLGEVRNIDKVIWLNTNNTLTPIGYQILVSKDNKNWTVAKEVLAGREIASGQSVIDTFMPTNARYLEFNFKATLSDDSPAISELEVVDARFTTDDIKGAENFLADPLQFTDACSFRKLLPSVGKYFNITVNIKTDWGTKTTQIPLVKALSNDITFVTQAGGTKLESVNLTFGKLPFSYTIENEKFTTIPFGEIKTFGLVKNFSKN